MVSATDVIVLASVDDDGRGATVEVDLAAGARLRSITVSDGDATADVLARAPEDADQASSGWGSYPMAPWAGRIRHGRFGAGDGMVLLARNHADGTGTGGGPLRPPAPPVDPEGPPAAEERWHAIHGTVFGRRWTVEELTGDRLVASCRLVDESDPRALGWPFPGTARQTITVQSSGVECLLEVTADDGVRFPAVIGWHPWFEKPRSLDVGLVAMYERDDLGLPTGALVEPPAGPWDDCFIAAGPAILRYDRAVAPVVTVSSDCDHLVVYDQPAHASCVEPQSGPPDAVNLPMTPSAAPDVVTSDSPLCRTMTISW